MFTPLDNEMVETTLKSFGSKMKYENNIFQQLRNKKYPLLM